ncbi:MAG TPA: hypothetical protein VFM90_03700 [Cyclobacteriaceae bacterium]|nr:hypothetical protein [Cyclobacteriaceae bacterium]
MNNVWLPVIFLFLSQAVLAQDYHPSETKIGKQEREELRERIKQEHAYFDSLYRARKLDSLEYLLSYHNTDTASYAGFTLYFEHVPGDYEKLLNELSANGFDTSEGASAFGYGFTFKKRRFVHELNFGFIWGDEMKSDNHETVKITGTNISYLFGFDLLNTTHFSVFPFINLHYQGVMLEYTRKPAGGQSFDNFLDVPAGVNHLDLRKNALRIGVGGEIDYYFTDSNRAGGIILGFRYGVNETLTEGKYKAEKQKINYDPEITLRNSYFALVLRFYGRTTFRSKR